MQSAAVNIENNRLSAHFAGCPQASVIFHPAAETAALLTDRRYISSNEVLLLLCVVNHCRVSAFW